MSVQQDANKRTLLGTQSPDARLTDAKAWSYFAGSIPAFPAHGKSEHGAQGDLESPLLLHPDSPSANFEKLNKKAPMQRSWVTSSVKRPYAGSSPVTGFGLYKLIGKAGKISYNHYFIFGQHVWKKRSGAKPGGLLRPLHQGKIRVRIPALAQFMPV